MPIRDGDEAAVQALAGDASAQTAVAHLVEDEEAGPAAPPPDLTAAAFFDVDNTLVQGSSLVHFARGLAARKYFTYGDLLRFGYAQAKFQLTGRENSDDVAAGRRKALAFIEGRSTAELVRRRRGDLRRDHRRQDLARHPGAGADAPRRRPAGVAGHRDALRTGGHHRHAGSG